MHPAQGLPPHPYRLPSGRWLPPPELPHRTTARTSATPPPMHRAGGLYRADSRQSCPLMCHAPPSLADARRRHGSHKPLKGYRPRRCSVGLGRRLGCGRGCRLCCFRGYGFNARCGRLRCCGPDRGHHTCVSLFDLGLCTADEACTARWDAYATPDPLIPLFSQSCWKNAKLPLPTDH